MPARGEEIVETLLLSPFLLVLVLVFLLLLQLEQHLMIVVGCLVALHLRIALLLECLQRFEESLPGSENRIHLGLHAPEAKSLRRLLEGLFPISRILCELVAQFFDLTPHTRNFILGSLQSEFFAPFDTLADAKNGSECESEGHDEISPCASIRSYVSQQPLSNRLTGLARQRDELLRGVLEGAELIRLLL
jgi:hypothetical protein